MCPVVKALANCATVWAWCLLQEATCCLLPVMSRGEKPIVLAWCLLQEGTCCLLPVMSILKKRSNGLGLLSATVQQAVDLLSATSYVTRRRNNGLGLLSVTKSCLLSATSHVNRKRKGYLQAIWFWSYLHFTWPSLSPTRTRPSEDVKVIKMGIARGPLKLCQNQKSFKIRFN